MNDAVLLSIAILTNGLAFALAKSVTKPEFRSSSYTFVFISLYSLGCLPLAIYHLQYPRSIVVWLLAASAALLYSLANRLNFRALQLMDLSLNQIIQRLNIIIVFIGGVIFYGESVSPLRVSGLLMGLLGIIIVAYHGRQNLGAVFQFTKRKNKTVEISEAVSLEPASDLLPEQQECRPVPAEAICKGVLLTVVFAFCAAAGALIDKKAVGHFSVFTYAFLQYSLQLPFLVWTPDCFREAVQIIRKYNYKVFASVAFGVISWITYMWLFARSYVSLIFASFRIGSLAVAVLLGILVLKEKAHLFRKLAGLTFTAAGLLMLNM